MTDSTITAVVFGAVTDWSQPLLTYYDHRSGERTELSGATLGNWAAKSANFFVDELGFVPGDEILVDLPEHWQTAAILLGAWWAGARVRFPGTDITGVGTAVTSAERIDAYGDVDELLVASLDPFAMGVRDLPVGVTDFASAVRVHGDQYSPIGAPTGPVLDDEDTATVLATARRAAADDGISAGTRVLTVRPWHDARRVIGNLVAPLAVGASLVTVSHPDEERLSALADTERADLTLR
ncbi:TIGR03089 family protein [Gordonia sp. HNM0687]|uniref:TIGR03089 family protein n=1 Tax=Gordonia mangrovi TaxID=2665643 RepID=A0A6L7GX79_9ACTN|nr:TIGR03089 family protein [Gordonia mangrovi]MXP23148.1 TIGR03089 family protein [Gordonia mangrovi]UVF77427.1 TIGR03089 family protein [Gordonia mangrovi]